MSWGLLSGWISNSSSILKNSKEASFKVSSFSKHSISTSSQLFLSSIWFSSKIRFCCSSNGFIAVDFSLTESPDGFFSCSSLTEPFVSDSTLLSFSSLNDLWSTMSSFTGISDISGSEMLLSKTEVFMTSPVKFNLVFLSSIVTSSISPSAGSWSDSLFEAACSISSTAQVVVNCSSVSLTVWGSLEFSFAKVLERPVGSSFTHLDDSRVSSWDTVESLALIFASLRSSLRSTFRFSFSIFFRSLCSNFSLLIAFFSIFSKRLSSFRSFTSCFTLLYSLTSWGSYKILLEVSSFEQLPVSLAGSLHSSPSWLAGSILNLSTGWSCFSEESFSFSVSSLYLRRSARIFSNLRAFFFFFLSSFSKNFLSSRSRFLATSSKRLSSFVLSSCLFIISSISIVIESSLVWLCLISSRILSKRSKASLFSSANSSLSFRDFSSSAAIIRSPSLDTDTELQSNSSSNSSFSFVLSSITTLPSRSCLIYSTSGLFSSAYCALSRRSSSFNSAAIIRLSSLVNNAESSSLNAFSSILSSASHSGFPPASLTELARLVSSCATSFLSLHNNNTYTWYTRLAKSQQTACHYLIVQTVSIEKL